MLMKDAKSLSKQIRPQISDSVLDTITNFGGEKYLPAVDGIKNRLIIEDNAEKAGKKKNWILLCGRLGRTKSYNSLVGE